jgi:hypothetical protein
MKHTLLISALLVTFGLVACDRPTVVAVPAAPVLVPVPGPAGPAGAQGNDGITGATGKTGENTTVIVTPPAPAPAN